MKNTFSWALVKKLSPFFRKIVFNAYFSQTGEQIEFCKMYPGLQSHFSGARHSPNSHPFVHFGIQAPVAVNS